MVTVLDADCPEGYFLLWSLKAANKFEQREQIHPLFITRDGDVFQTYAQTFWAKFSTSELPFKVSPLAFEDKGVVFSQLQSQSEELLMPAYEKLAQLLEIKAEQTRLNRTKAFEFQMRQVHKIGIEHIRNHRARKYQSEYEIWNNNFTSASQVVPELSCLLLLKVNHG